MASKTKEKILEKAYTMFSTQGYEQTSLSTLAKELSITKAALYYHFQSKEQIFETLYFYIIEGIKEGYVINDETSDKDSYIIYLRDVGLKTIDSLSNNKDLPALLMQYYLLGLRNKKIKLLTESLEEATRVYFAKIVEIGVSCGCFDKTKQEEYVEMITIMDQGLLEKANRLDIKTLKSIWLTFVLQITK